MLDRQSLSEEIEAVGVKTQALKEASLATVAQLHRLWQKVYAATETAPMLPSSPDTGMPAVLKNGQSTSSESLDVKVEIPGEPVIMATVTFHDCSFTLTPGLVQRFLRDGHWTPQTQTTPASPPLSGPAPSNTQAVVAAGQSAGGLDD